MQRSGLSEGSGADRTCLCCLHHRPTPPRLCEGRGRTAHGALLSVDSDGIEWTSRRKRITTSGGGSLRPAPLTMANSTRVDMSAFVLATSREVPRRSRRAIQTLATATSGGWQPAPAGNLLRLPVSAKSPNFTGSISTDTLRLTVTPSANSIDSTRRSLQLGSRRSVATNLAEYGLSDRAEDIFDTVLANKLKRQVFVLYVFSIESAPTSAYELEQLHPSDHQTS